jgi:hypothetical protein
VWGRYLRIDPEQARGLVEGFGGGGFEDDGEDEILLQADTSRAADSMQVRQQAGRLGC